MSIDDDDITDFVRELQLLHLRQSELLAQLATADRRSTPVSRTTEHNQGQVAPAQVSQTTFRIGDHVRITNPCFLQPTTGIIIRISATRITIRTPAGNTIVRAPKNIVHIL